jgi:hypothetical protein
VKGLWGNYVEFFALSPAETDLEFASDDLSVWDELSLSIIDLWQ